MESNIGRVHLQGIVPIESWLEDSLIWMAC